MRRTGDIGLLKIVSESAVASGVRRIEALTGEGARAYLAAQEARVREAAELLKVSPDDMIERLAAVLDERRKLERQLAEAKRELALGGGCGEREPRPRSAPSGPSSSSPAPCKAWRRRICAGSSTMPSANLGPASPPSSA